MSWRPLLEGALAESARESVRAIADSLEDETLEISLPSFAYGHAGLALLHGYLAVAYGDQRAADRAWERLSRAIDGASEPTLTLSPSFYVGVSGIAWTNQHLEELLAGEAGEGVNDEVDECIAEVVRTSPWPGRYDLIYGLVGFGRYALDHPRRAFTTEVVGQIVERLAESSVSLPEGIAWRTSPQVAPLSMAQNYPRGYFDLGLSHGVPGVISFLARSYQRGVAVELARPLLYGAVAWLLANKRYGDGGSTFGSFFGEPEPSGAAAASCRSAWCYGDPGVAVALLTAARATGEPLWEREAIAIAGNDCARSIEDTGVVDAEVCHGAAGLGHVYNRLYQATGEEVFALVARAWFERTLAMYRPGKGVAGYVNWWPEAGEWHTDPGLLTGAAGIGLALLAASSPIEPNWDRPFLLDIPPEGGA
jgi:lantibiotic modifying enzyme